MCVVTTEFGARFCKRMILSKKKKNGER